MEGMAVRRVYTKRRRRSTWPQASADAGRVGGRGMAGRVRVLGGFAAFGAFWGAWGATLPAIQSHAGVDDGQLGVALLFIGAGALASMRGAGSLVDRWGAPALPAVLAALGGAAVLPGLATSTATLCAALLVLGATSGAVDVAIMPRAHAPRRAAAGRC